MHLLEIYKCEIFASAKESALRVGLWKDAEQHHLPRRWEKGPDGEEANTFSFKYSTLSGSHICATCSLHKAITGSTQRGTHPQASTAQIVIAKRDFLVIDFLRRYALTSLSGNGTRVGACLSTFVKSSLQASAEPRCESRCCPSLRLRTQKFRFAEKDATVERVATAQQGARHESDRSNKFMTRSLNALLVPVCTPPVASSRNCGAQKCHNCTFDQRTNVAQRAWEI